MSHHHQHNALEGVLEALREHGLRITAPRKRLAQMLCDVGTPMSIEALHQQLGRNDFDLVTLYRGLDAFEEAGVVQVVRDQDGKSLYEMIDVDHGHHHHVICRQCGQIDCLSHCAIEPFENAARAMGYAQLTHRIELYGVCSKCSSSRK